MLRWGCPGDLQVGGLRAVPAQLVRGPLQGTSTRTALLAGTLHQPVPAWPVRSLHFHLAEQNTPPHPISACSVGRQGRLSARLRLRVRFRGALFAETEARRKKQRESNLPALCMRALSTRHRNEECKGGDSANRCPYFSLLGPLLGTPPPPTGYSPSVLCPSSTLPRPGGEPARCAPPVGQVLPPHGPPCGLPSQDKASPPPNLYGAQNKSSPW